MDALANGWAGSKDVIMVRARLHWPMDGLVARTSSGIGHDALAKGWTGSMDVIMVWAWMGWQHGRDHGLGTLANGLAGSMNVIMGWAWMQT